MDEDEFFEILCEHADAVIKLVEVDPKKEYREKVFQKSIDETNKFIEQLDKKLYFCKTEDEKTEIKEIALNFHIFSLKKLLVHYNCPDENIEFFGDEIKRQILTCRKCHGNH